MTGETSHLRETFKVYSYKRLVRAAKKKSHLEFHKTLDELKQDLSGKTGSYFPAHQYAIESWAGKRGILKNSTALTQLETKMKEELEETIEALKKDDADEIKDGLGDMGVVWIISCRLQGIEPCEALNKALKTILPRTGHLTEDGVFVKDE